MRWLRTTWGSRPISAGLLVCLLLSVFGAGMRGDSQPVCAPYEAWLRAQLRVPADVVLEEAIEEAVSSRPRTLTAFLSTFVAAYEARNPQTALATAFLTQDLSNEALITYLETRFNGVGAEGVPVRGNWQTMLVPSGKAPDRHEAGVFAVAFQALLVQASAFVQHVEAVQPHVRLLRILSAAQPLGP